MMKTKTFAAAVVVAALTLAACSTKAEPKHYASAPKATPTTNTVDAVNHWKDLYGSDVAAIGDDMVTLGDDASNGDVAAVGADCLIVKADVQVVLGNPPIPEPTAAADLAGLTASLNSAMDACITAVSTDDLAQLDTMYSDLTNASQYLNSLSNDLGLGA